MKVSTIAEMAKRKNVGDLLELGQYQIQSGAKPYDYPVKIYMPWEWYVLAREGNRMLLLSRDCVDWDFIDGTGNSQTWEHCYARTELLPKMLEENFTEEERTLILPARLHTGDNPDYGTRGGDDTEDKLFFLSTEEFVRYVPAKAAPARLYLLEHLLHSQQEEGTYGLESDWTVWWLRSPGEKQWSNAVVGRRGDLDTAGFENSCDELGIRPAVWIDLSQSDPLEERKPKYFYIDQIKLPYPDEEDLPF